ncbi:AcrR family transcriptional regulator [Paraburkholderia sp. EB58]|uniref:TetR/AcrR family transcriptional regulator n=1 Tax=Paraburkholderia sp. EB58 TaxID=3035125 RepID=UPI003D1BABB0
MAEPSKLMLASCVRNWKSVRGIARGTGRAILPQSAKRCALGRGIVTRRVKARRLLRCRIRVNTRFLSGRIVTTNRRQSLKPRKIPQQSRAEQTVATILEAAARVLESKGLDGLNTNLVAQRAGVSVGTLYQYFPGKDAIIVALSKREHAVFLVEAKGALGQPTGQRALNYLIAVSVHQQLRRPVLARALDFEENRPAIAKELAKDNAAFGELIRQILDHDDIPQQPSTEVATDDLLAILRAMVDAAGERGEVDRAALESRVGRALLGYLGIVDRQPEKSRVRK